MPSNVLGVLQAWILSLLLYPGLLFSLLLAMAGEWSLQIIRPIFTPRLYRQRARSWHFLQPIYELFKLAGRSAPASWQPLGANPGLKELGGGPALASALAPLLALILLPLPGNPLVLELGPLSNLLLVMALLAVQPLVAALLHLRAGGVEDALGAQTVGRFITGLLPVLLVLAALAEVAESTGVLLVDLLPAPETASQTLVRLLAGVVLMLALPWWLDWGAAPAQGDCAGTYLGRLLQTVALSTLWSLVVLPMPGVLPWALVVSIGGALFAYLGIRLVGERWAPAAKERDAARLLWATSLPVSGLALALAFWPV